MENSHNTDPQSDSREDNPENPAIGIHNAPPQAIGQSNSNSNSNAVILNFPSLNAKGRTVTNDLNGTNNPVTLKQNEIKPLTSNHTDKEKPKQSKTKIDDLYSNYTAIGDKGRVYMICFMIAICLCFIILGLAAPLFTYEAKVIGGAVVAVALFSILTSCLTIYIIHKNRVLINEVVGLKDDPEKINQSRERMLLYVCCYFMMLIFMFFLLIGCGLIVYQSDIKMRIRGIGYDKVKWQNSFGTDNFKKVINKVTILLNALAGFCFLFCFYFLALLISILVMIKSYRTWKLMIQFVCIVFFQISFVFIHYGTNGIKFKNVTLIEDAMPGWVTYGLFGIGIVGLFIGLLAFFITFIEHKRLLFAYSIISVIMCIILILLNIGGTMINANFKGYIEADCNLLYSYVDETYLMKELHCDSKYLFTTNTLLNVQCPKYRIVNAWEFDENRPEGNEHPTYGCINQNCCMVAYSFIKEKYDYLILISYILMLISMSFIFFSWYLIRNLEKYYDEGIRDNFIYYFILAMLIVIALIMIPFLAMIPKAPLSSVLSEMQLGNKRLEAAVINADIVIPMTNQKFGSANAEIQAKTTERVISENQYTVTFKTTSRINRRAGAWTINAFQVKLESENAYIMENPSNRFDDTIKMLYNKTTEVVITGNDSEEKKKKDVNEIKLEGDVKFLNNYLRYIIVQPYCEVAKVIVKMTITGNATAATVRNVIEEEDYIIERQLQTSTNRNSFEIDLTGNSIKEDDVIVIETRELDFSTGNTSHPITMTGTVHNKIKSSVIVYPLYNPNCSDYLPTEFSISTGDFTIGPLYPHKSAQPLLYNITISSILPNKKHNPYINIFTIGGIDEMSIGTDLGTIYYSPSTKNTSHIQGTVVDSASNDPINKIEVQLYEEYLYFNPSESPEGNKQFTESTRSKSEGNILFKDLSAGQYTLAFISPEYYLETIHLNLGEDELYDLGTISLTRMRDLGELSFVLSWGKDPIDLDLYASFPLDSSPVNPNEEYCTVSFTNYNCIDMRLSAKNDFGGLRGVESISMKNMEEHYYMFYVHKYYDKSNDIALNESRIEGLEKMPQYDTTDIADVPLSKSKATIKVYGPGYRSSILSLQLQQDDSKYDDSSYSYWLAFCINGKEGISSYKVINQMLQSEPDKNYCKDYYTKG